MAERSTSFQRIKYAARAEYRYHSKFTLIHHLLLGLGFTLFVIFEIYSLNRHYYGSDVGGVAYCLFVAAVLIGFFLTSTIFKDIGNVQVSDVQLSLPLSAVERFYSKLLAIFYIQLLPMMIYIGSSQLIVGFYAAAKTNKWELMSELVMVIVGFIASALFIDAVAVFCCCCCGAFAESIYFSMILAGCLSLTPAFFVGNIIADTSGVQIQSMNFLDIWTLSWILNMGDFTPDSSEMNYYILRLVINCLISLGVMLLSVLIYKRRDGRDVGDPIVFKPFFELIMFFGVFTVSTIVIFNVEFYIAITITAVIYVAINIIVTRAKLSIKNFFIWILKYCAANALFVAIAAGAYFTNGYGYVNHMPSKSMAGADVDISLYYQYSASGYYWGWRYPEQNQGDFDDVYFYAGQLSDEQIRDIAKIYIKHVKRQPRTWRHFLSALESGNLGLDDSVNAYLGVWTREERTMYDVITKEHMYRNMNINKDIAYEMMNELEKFGYLTKQIEYEEVYEEYYGYDEELDEVYY